MDDSGGHKPAAATPPAGQQKEPLLIRGVPAFAKARPAPAQPRPVAAEADGGGKPRNFP